MYYVIAVQLKANYYYYGNYGTFLHIANAGFISLYKLPTFKKKTKNNEVGKIVSYVAQQCTIKFSPIIDRW